MKANLVLMLPIMLFLHIVDDYYLQGILLNMKQKKWWEPYIEKNSLYSDDYKMALVEHAFSWSFMINLPWIIYTMIYEVEPFVLTILVSLIINTIIHAIIDNEKANKNSINLILDQTFHIIQIICTFLLYSAMGVGI